jgi:RES domain-containing protein
MEVFRITKKKYANLDGAGGLVVAGRWNNKGTRIVYSGGSRSLSILEFMVHINDVTLLPSDMVMLTIVIPEQKVLDISDKLSTSWKNKVTESRKLMHSHFNNRESLVYKVPSVIVPQEYNYIIDPLYPEIGSVQIKEVQDFTLDSRLL